MKRRDDFVAPAVFDRLCMALGPVNDGGNKRVAAVLGRCTKSVGNWRSGAATPPRWAYELLRLTLDERHRVYLEMTGVYRASKLGFGAGAARLSLAIGLHYGAAANDSAWVVGVPLREEM